MSLGYVIQGEREFVSGFRNLTCLHSYCLQPFISGGQAITVLWGKL